ncbi:hypothetical protein NHX12_028366, partial [Muraenolepis orangiensis]
SITWPAQIILPVSAEASAVPPTGAVACLPRPPPTGPWRASPGPPPTGAVACLPELRRQAAEGGVGM